MFVSIKKNWIKEKLSLINIKSIAYLLEIVFHQIFLENNFILWQAK